MAARLTCPHGHRWAHCYTCSWPYLLAGGLHVTRLVPGNLWLLLWRTPMGSGYYYYTKAVADPWPVHTGVDA